MTEPTLQTLQILKIAAELRIEGNPWSVVAKRIGRSNADSARLITREHPGEWRMAYEEARAEYLPSVEAEALLTQRELMRPMRQLYDEITAQPVLRDGKPVLVVRDEKIRQSAAHSILNHTRHERASRINVLHSGEVTHRLTLEQRREADEVLRRFNVNAN